MATLHSGNEFRREFKRYARKRVRQLKSTLHEIVERMDTEAVHDFRKTTRHLQTIVDTCAIRGPSSRTMKIRRRLQKCRHALSQWRDCDVILVELKKARRIAHTKDDRQCWSEVAARVAKRRRRTMKKFLRRYRSLKVKAIAAKAMALVRKNARADSLMDNLRLYLERCWTRWSGAIDDFIDKAAVPELHQVRVKTKTLRYAIELSNRFYPDRHLERAGRWLEDFQNRVGEWHDELMLGQSALKTFSGSGAPRDPGAINVIREAKEKEIELAESARNFILSIRKTSDYRLLRRALSASVYAMTTNGSDAGTIVTDSITGPIQ
jgi:CHAD domain-containing protein